MQNIFSRLAEILPDKVYLNILFFRHHHRLLNLNDPQNFNDQIQWLKLNGKLERFSQFVDKYTVRGYVESKIGKEYLVPMYGVWDNFDDIDFSLLPQQFVLKATHGCGYNYICKDKSKINLPIVKKNFDKWMKENFYIREREPQYKNCQPRIIAEKYLEDQSDQLTDYKFYCSKGNVTDIQVNVDRFSSNMIDQHMDVNWKTAKSIQNKLFSLSDKPVKKPRQFSKMLLLAQKLSEDFPFVRVDLYYAEDKIYFGELTFTPGSGLIKFDRTANTDQEFARILKIDLAAY
jgi:hypothetical protein